MLKKPICNAGFSQHHFFSKNGAGFSLIEILTAISIMALLAGISAPFFINYSQNQELKNSAKQFIGHLKEIQQYAVTTQVKHAVVPDLLTGNYDLIKKNQPDELLSTRALSNQVIFSSTTGLTNNEAVFNAAGGAEASGEIIITHQQSGKQIEISLHPSGYVTWEEL